MVHPIGAILPVPSVTRRLSFLKHSFDVHYDDHDHHHDHDHDDNEDICAGGVPQPTLTWWQNDKLLDQSFET